MSSAIRSVALLAVALVLVIGTAVFSYRSSLTVAETAVEGASAQETLQEAQTILTLVTDAETGQRGYLLTDDAAYLPRRYHAEDAVHGTHAGALQDPVHHRAREPRIGVDVGDDDPMPAWSACAHTAGSSGSTSAKKSRNSRSNPCWAARRRRAVGESRSCMVPREAPVISIVAPSSSPRRSARRGGRP